MGTGTSGCITRSELLGGLTPIWRVWSQCWGRAEIPQFVSPVTVPKLGTRLGLQPGGTLGCHGWQLPAPLAPLHNE